jgi:thioredoxin reductase (NADPH)
MEKHDLIIIGTGPGGYSAAIYAARYQMDVILIGQIPGGIAGTAHDIRNYPGFPQISGMELSVKMAEQTKELGVPIIQDMVIDIKKVEEGFLVRTKNKEFLGKKIIISTGTERKKLGLNREEELLGKGISYCATCDAGFYKDKVAGVVGGGDAALTAALLIAKFAKKVYIIYRKEKFTKAEVSWITEAEKTENIKFLFNSEVSELIGEEKLEKVKLKDGKEIELDGLFIEVGGTPNTKLSEELGLELENGSIKVDNFQRTNVPGVFAAGDVTNRPFKQIVCAAGDGATALSTAFKEIEKEKSSSE